METVKRLVAILGRMLVARIAGVECSFVKRWEEGSEVPDMNIMPRLELALQFAERATRSHSHMEVQHWFTHPVGENGNNATPVQILSEANQDNCERRLNEAYMHSECLSKIAV